MSVKSINKHAEELRLALVREIEGGRSVPEMSRASGIARSTLYGWVERLAVRKLGTGELKEAGELQKAETGNGGISQIGGQVFRPRPSFTDEFKIAAVREVEAGKKVPELAVALGVTKGALYRWCKEFASNRTVAADGDKGVSVEEIKARMLVEDEQREREKDELLRTALGAKADAMKMVADPLIWMQEYTQTKDSHWREAGANSPYRPFPKKPYFRCLVEAFQAEPVLFVEKSRDMMLSWLFVGLFTHAAMTTPGIEVLFQSQTMEKAVELVEYAKILYDRQGPELQRAFPLARALRYMADGVLEFAHGSRIVGIPGGGDQIRSYHPWGLLQDEAAFMPEAGDSYDNAVSVCQKIVVVSSAGPGWFAEVCNSAV